MAVDLMLFVSKRASAAAGLLCLAAAHLALQVAAAPAAASAGEVRVAILR